MVYAHTLNVYPFDTYAAFCAPFSPRPHRNVGTLLRIIDERRSPLHAVGLLRDLPISQGLGDSSPTLEAAGREYYDFRATLMVGNDEGMTRTYNRFHDPYEKDADIAELRRLHTSHGSDRARRLRLDRYFDSTANSCSTTR